jgi:3-deoxy-manno-octulosonate cytidylyltransferase (CMP-KDO synthetase)
MTSTPFRAVIPARYASSRFPGKALAGLGGRPMLQHVYERARASGASEVIVATDDARIADAARAFGADVAMTSPEHVSGTERVAEVAAQRHWPADALIVNCQGDVPLIPPASIAQVADLLREHPLAAITTLCAPIESAADYRSPHVVKVVCDGAGRALYFSRSPIPAPGHGTLAADAFPASWRHIGLYGYRVAGLLALARAPACYIEECEKLEQLRALWLGLEIRVAVARELHGPDVDTPDDLRRAADFLRSKGAEQ